MLGEEIVSTSIPPVASTGAGTEVAILLTSFHRVHTNTLRSVIYVYINTGEICVLQFCLVLSCKPIGFTLAS